MSINVVTSIELDDVVVLPLSRGYVALVDKEDAAKVGKGKWYLLRTKSGHVYAQGMTRFDGTSKITLLHRMIMEAQPGELIDHRNGRGLDCRRSNLRKSTRGQNGINAGLSRRSKTGFKGVAWHKREKKFQANIRIDGRQIHLGLFNSPEDAARAYDQAARKYHPECARFNFPRLNERGLDGAIRTELKQMEKYSHAA